MNEHPILFSGPMVRAILEGRKSQTRRIAKCPASGHTQPIRDGSWEWSGDGGFDQDVRKLRCPYGAPGDRLWVRETHKFTVRQGWTLIRVDYAAGGFKNVPSPSPVPCEPTKWRPSIFMPRWACRLVLEVTGVRVERLQAIKGKDILSEGAVLRAHDDQFGHNPVSAFDGKVYLDLQSLWAAGWDGINRKRAPWASNPWVWVVEFKRTA